MDTKEDKNYGSFDRYVLSDVMDINIYAYGKFLLKIDTVGYQSLELKDEEYTLIVRDNVARLELADIISKSELECFLTLEGHSYARHMDTSLDVKVNMTINQCRLEMITMPINCGNHGGTSTLAFKFKLEDTDGNQNLNYTIEEL